MLNEMFYMFLFMLGLKKHFGHISLGTSHISGAQQPHVATDRIAGSRQGSRESRGPGSVSLQLPAGPTVGTRRGARVPAPSFPPPGRASPFLLRGQRPGVAAPLGCPKMSSCWLSGKEQKGGGKSPGWGLKEGAAAAWHRDRVCLHLFEAGR